MWAQTGMEVGKGCGGGMWAQRGMEVGKVGLVPQKGRHLSPELEQPEEGRGTKAGQEAGGEPGRGRRQAGPHGTSLWQAWMGWAPKQGPLEQTTQRGV